MLTELFMKGRLLRIYAFYLDRALSVVCDRDSNPESCRFHGTVPDEEIVNRDENPQGVA